MSHRQHPYHTSLIWTGNTGQGTAGYRTYKRDYRLEVTGKPVILGSSDPAFMGDPSRHNPEELFVAALSSCHMLWYLHLCSVKGITVVAYSDAAVGIMNEHANGAGEFSSVTLRPQVTIIEADKVDEANRLHKKAGEMCFIARSVKTPILYEASVTIAAVDQ